MRLNSNISKLSESMTLRLNAEAKALQARGIRVVNLTAGELDFETPRFIQRNVGKKLSFNKYTPALGSDDLRKQIAASVKKEYRWNVDAKNVAVTAGAKQALFELFQVILEPGDEVIIPTPSWISYEHQVALAGGRPVFVSLGERFDLDVLAIERKLSRKTKAIILNSPHNPTGAVFSKRSLVNLVRLLEKKHVFFVVDDIYRKLIFSRGACSPAQCVANRDWLILVNGFSKSHALTGWRIGYVIAHPEIIRGIGAFQSHTSGNASVISQQAAIECLTRPETPRDFVRVLQRRRTLVLRELRKIRGLRFQVPQGAFYFFLDISSVEKDSERFCERLLSREHVALVLGEAFHAQGFVRLSFAAKERTLQNACIRLKRFIDSY